MSKPIIHSLIPARGGSKSIKDKNILPLNGHPLIAYSIAASKLCTQISKTVVTTDSLKIAEVAKVYGAEVPFLRPASLAQDNSLDIEFFKHYLDHLKFSNESIPDLIVHLRPTTPLRDPVVIDDAITQLLKNPSFSGLRSAQVTNLTPYKIFRKVNECMEPFISLEGELESANLPRQRFEAAYLPNGYVDIIRPSTLLQTGMLHGKTLKLYETQEVPDIDYFQDYQLAIKLLGDERFITICNYLKRYI